MVRMEQVAGLLKPIRGTVYQATTTHLSVNQLSRRMITVSTTGVPQTYIKEQVIRLTLIMQPILR